MTIRMRGPAFQDPTGGEEVGAQAVVPAEVRAQELQLCRSECRCMLQLVPCIGFTFPPIWLQAEGQADVSVPVDGRSEKMVRRWNHLHAGPCKSEVHRPC
jgi:hypothetical protein